MAQALEIQAIACERLGSEMYSRLFSDLAIDYKAHGPTYEILHGCSNRPVNDAIPLRLAGALHRVVLQGDDQALARHYPTVGGSPTANFTSEFIASFPRHISEIEHGLRSQVQTNEVGRSVVHLVLTHWLTRFGISECEWLELGASAGLNLNFDKFFARRDHLLMGDPLSELSFPDSWFASTPDIGPECVSVSHRRGVDVSPIDVCDPSEEWKLLSFVWPDQKDRMNRLQAAISIAKSHPPVVDAQSADTWLQQQLLTSRESPVVVFHSITWQYLGEHVQKSLKETLHAYGAHTSLSRPLVWARMEPAGAVADVRATVWQGDTVREFRLAEIGYHGQDMQWIGEELLA